MKIPLKVAHYGRFDPRTTTGGVETFARNLGIVFEEVEFLTPKTTDFADVMRRKLPVICDNQLVADWPQPYPVIGFQHGVAAVKATLTKTRTDKKLAKAQAKAASRPNTIWVACARWISRTFEHLQGNAADHVVYHQVDIDRFDGRLDNEGSTLVLHDGRSEHKGKALFEHLVRALPQWRFESLNCTAAEVPDRMRKAAAFLHLSRYEGNSIVCNEAMAMDLPCLFTRVGLMQDGEDLDVSIVDAEEVYGPRDRLETCVRQFLDGLTSRQYNPRRWSLANATPAAHAVAWRKVMVDLHKRGGWALPPGLADG
ncbi:MAG: hypothetical protein AAF799_17970 [Myxococcota bacterium]